MNEQLQYAEMIEVPVSTCNITYKPKRKWFKKREKKATETVKEELIEKINAETPETQTAEEEIEQELLGQAVETSVIGKKKSKFAIGVVGIQIVAVISLVAVILVTNFLNENSGINNLIKGTFNQVKTDAREYGDFELSLPSSSVTVENGVMTIGRGSVYPSCNGKVTSLVENENGTFDMELTYSDNFKSVFSGLYYVYANVGDKVYKNVPVGYSQNQVKFCFYGGNGDMITDYSLENGSIVWA